MKKRGEGILVKTVGSDIYDYAVSMDEGNFFITNGDEEIREEDVGKRIIVDYEPEWPCCQFVCFHVFLQRIQPLRRSGKGKYEPKTKTNTGDSC